MTSVFPAASAPADVLPSVPVRGVRAPELPSSLVFAHSDAAVADALAQTLAELELRRPLFALGRAGRNLPGRPLRTSACRQPRPSTHVRQRDGGSSRKPDCSRGLALGASCQW